MMKSPYLRLDNRTLLAIVHSLEGVSSLNQTQTEASLHASLHVLHENIMLRDKLKMFLEADNALVQWRFTNKRVGNAWFTPSRWFAHQDPVDPQELVDQRDASWREYEMLRKLVDHTNRSIQVKPS